MDELQGFFVTRRQRLRRQTENDFAAEIPIEFPRDRIIRPQPKFSRFDSLPAAFLTFPESFLEDFLLGYITEDLRRADHFPLAIVDRRHRKRYGDSTTRFAH